MTVVKYGAAPETVVASAAKTVTGNSGALWCADRPGSDLLHLLVDVTAVAGTSPTMDLTVEWSMDGTTFAAADTADAFTQITATGTVVGSFTIKAPQYRVVWTLGGTSPSFTMSVTEYTT